MDDAKRYWSFAPSVLFEGSTEAAVLKLCSKKTRAFWKKVASKKDGFIYVQVSAFTGGKDEWLPDDFVVAWGKLVMGVSDLTKSSLARAMISNHHLRAIYRTYATKKEGN